MKLKVSNNSRETKKRVIEKLSVNTPSGEVRLKVLKEIAQEYNLEWDSSSTEAELGKKHEDLLVHLII